MDLVIDANILFAVCISSGKTEEVLFSEELHLFAPEFIFEEFKNDKKLKNQDKIQIITTEELAKFLNL